MMEMAWQWDNLRREHARQREQLASGPRIKDELATLSRQNDQCDSNTVKAGENVGDVTWLFQVFLNSPPDLLFEVF